MKIFGLFFVSPLLAIIALAALAVVAALTFARGRAGSFFGAAFQWLVFGLITLFALASPAAADTGTATSLAWQPMISDLLQLAITVLAAIAIYVLPKFAFISNNAALSNNLTKLLWDAAHYAIANDKSLAAGVSNYVGSFRVDNPIVAAAGNWLLTHADSEIKGLNLSDAEVASSVQAIIPQVCASLSAAISKGKTS